MKTRQKRFATPGDPEGVKGWSGGAMALGKLPAPGRPTDLDYIVGQGPTVLAVGEGGGCLDIFSRLSFRSSFSLSLEDGPI